MWYQNLQMGINVLEAARFYKTSKVLLCGTVCAFPKVPPHIPFVESDIWMGYPEETNAPYGLAKKMMLEGARTYRAQYGLNAIYVTPTNMYGPRDNFNLTSSHVLPALIRKIHTAVLEGQQEVVLWGTGSASREFLYVDECIRGLINALEKYESPESLNIGSGVETTIKELAELIARLLDYKGRFVWDTSKPDGQPRRFFDISRARKEIGYEPQISLEEGVRRTIDWWRENYTSWSRV
jgi:GDP-L-fucose synthase